MTAGLEIEWLPVAVEQLLSIVDHIGEESPAAAVELARTIRAAAETLASYPNRYRAGRIKGTRELVVKPNYIIVYRVTDRIQILRVRHARMQDK